MANKLGEYKKKRKFNETPEPSGVVNKVRGVPLDHQPRIKKTIFVVQKHHASQLHYDFRLEIDGVLKSWAVPKGPSSNPVEKRLAMPTEDHPMDYADFEGIIPGGNYGAGRVIIWDNGTFASIKDEDLLESFKNGRLELELKGKKMNGKYALIRIKPRNEGDKIPWLLFKMNGDEWVGKSYVGGEKSVISGRLVEELGNNYEIKKSKISGKGTFATHDLKKGTNLGLAFKKIKSTGIEDKNYERTELGRMTNHSKTPNVELIKEKEEYHFKTTKNVKAKEELLINYEKFSWDGKKKF